MMTSFEIRKTFMDFFALKQHAIVPSAPIVVKNDPTLLFTNAGMNQFKDYFLGNSVPSNKRIADTQKCLRVSGKHNDLEEVGVDTYHHTMFEMLGNWSFGDYFKKEAIQWSWELLTEVYKLDKDRLYVTVFEGDVKEGLPKDEEAYNEWKKYTTEERILNGNKKDNFWEMGDTGPCGPCTEIHVDCRSDEERTKVSGRELVNADHPQVIEIWNNVFMQFNRLKDGTLQPLPAQHVDTGMGLERLVRVIQNKTSNYDTDLFTGTISEVEKITSKKYDYSDSKQAVAFRVLADHIRAIAFTIADGQLPSNTGAGYVIRRILRRAVRYYFSYLEHKQPLLHQLIPVLAKQFEEVFPELTQQVDFVSKVVREEETSFLKTVSEGLIRINNLPYWYYTNLAIEKFEDNYDPLNKEVIDFIHMNAVKSGFEISGIEAFNLSDTYGFPIDLTQLIASEKDWVVDVEGYQIELQKQKDRSRSATAIDTEDWIIVNDGDSKFLGYETNELTTKIARYRKVKSKTKEGYQIVLNETPFYAESGGQVGDTGELTIQNSKIKITNTKKENNLIIHFADEIPADLSGEVIAKIDVTRRQKTEVHHSATHLLHAALRQVLGKHVAQKGSLVNDENLRFDFSHFAKVTDEEVQQIEAIVNEKIRENIPVVIKEMEKDEAIALGAMALFGEKYGDKVRVVMMDPNYSIELCGGTHVGATGQLGYLKIIHESAVAAGVRRIEAVSGKAAENYLNVQLQTLNEVKAALKNPKELLKSVEGLNAENSSLKKQLESFEAKQTTQLKNDLLKKIQVINDINFIGEVIEVSNADALKKIANDVKSDIQNFVIALAANVSGKAFTAVGIADELTATHDAVKIIKKHIAPLIKGGGGGSKTLATAGGQDVNNLNTVIEKVKSLL